MNQLFKCVEVSKCYLTVDSEEDAVWAENVEAVCEGRVCHLN